MSLCLAAAGCAQLGQIGAAVPALGDIQESGQTRPVARPDTMSTQVSPVSETARTAEEFDTTTPEQRDAATETLASGADRDLGLTIASLGNPAEPGFWLKTPLVSEPGPGRVEFPEKGTSVIVELIPADGERGAGSQMSLAAMRLLDAPLTGLPEVRVIRIDG